MASFTITVSSGAAAIIQQASAFYGYPTPGDWIRDWIRNSCINYQRQQNEAALPDPNSAVAPLFST